MKDNLDFFDIDLDKEENELKTYIVNKNDNPQQTHDVVKNDIDSKNNITDKNNCIVSVSNDVTDNQDNYITGEESDEDISDNNTPAGSRRIARVLISYMLVVAFAFLLAYVTNHYLIVNARIPTGSMIPTIMEENRLIGNRLAYIYSKPKRGDIIVFYNPDDVTQSEKYIKRIIGLPGETVEIIDGIVYINGQKLDESAYIVTTPYGSYGPYTVPQDCYFMMGDNRNSSLDSRFWTHTYVERSKIIAKAIFIYYPELKWLK